MALRIAREGGAAAAIHARLAAGLLTVVALAAAGWMAPGDRHAPGDRIAPGLALVVAVACVSWVGTGVRAITTATGPLPALIDRGGAAELSGRVASEPRRVGERWQTIIALDRVGDRPVRTRVVLLRDEVPASLGERVDLRATVGPLPDGGYGRWLARQHATAMVVPVGPILVTPAGPVVAATERLRAGLRREAASRAPAAPAGLVVGLVTGDVRSLPEADEEAMRAAGLSHLTAVSGSNVALVLGAVAGLAALVRLPARARWLLLVATTAWFALLTRFEPSVLRAGTMAGLVVLAAARGIVRDAVHLLAGAVLVLVLIDPLLAGSLGLLLSAGATLGVLVVAPAVLARLPRRLPRPVAALVAVSVGAQVAVAPILVATFGTVPLVSLPANLLAVPLAAIASAIATASAVLVPFAPDLAARGLAVAARPAALVLMVAHRAAGMPIAVGGRPLLAIAAGVTLMAVARRRLAVRARGS
jgi:competence protein ComEC